MSWSISRLGDIAQIFNGKTPSKNEKRNDGFPILKIKDINSSAEFKGNFDSYVDEEFYRQHSKKKIRVGDTLILNAAHNSSYVGSKQFKACGKVDGVIATGEWLIVRPNPELANETYVNYWLMSKKTRFYIRDLVKGIHLYPKDVERLKIPLPKLDVQKRIAAILDKADAMRRKRQQAIELSEQLLRSVFLDMFGDPVSNPKGYKLGKIGDLLSSVNYGTSSKAGENGQFPILRMNNITYAGNWELGSLKYIDMDEKERKKYTAEPGDILFNRTNSKELVGKTAVFREKEPYIFAGYLIRSRTNSLAEPEYISGFLNSAYGKKVLRNMCKSIVGMANINAKEYQSIEILIPPIEEQQKYAKITKKIRLNICCYQDSLNKFDELFNSLSQKAFIGELNKLPETSLA